MNAVPQTARARTPREIAYYRPVLRRNHFAPRYWPTWLVLALLRLLAVLPLVLSRLVGSLLGLLMYATNAKRRRIARINLRLCFPEWSERDRARLLRRHFVVYGQSFTDAAHLAWNSRRRLRGMVRLRGIEHFRQLLAQGRRVVLLAPHLAGINVGGTVLSAECPTISTIKPLRNAVLNWFLNRARVRFGAGILTRDQGLRPAIHALKQGKAFYYLPDEDLGLKNAVFAPFFGVPTATLATLGRIAEIADAAVIPCFVRLLGWGRGYEVMLSAPLENFPTGNEVADAARMNQVIEDGVRRMPEQYMWTFTLFRTRPDNQPSPYERVRRR